MDKITQQCVNAYSELKHLKLAGEKVGIPWQTVYVHLKRAGVSVTGDKARYGSVSDRLAAKAEKLFSKAVPFVVDNNVSEFQSTIDFTAGRYGIDIKASRLREYPGKRDAPKWGFCISKQKDKADFFVLYAFDSTGDKVLHIFLMPKEIATSKQTISIPATLCSKWADYIVQRGELKEFFRSLTVSP
jgi:hypothetical protein